MSMGFELFVGAVVGFILNMLFGTVNLCGEQVSFNMSFSMVQSMDPTNDTETDVISNVQNVFVMLVFLSSGFYIRFAKLMVDSFYRIDLLGSIQVYPLLNLLTSFVASLFVVGLQLALPVIILSLLLNLVLALLARMVSGLDVFLLGIDLRIILGFFILIASLPVFLLVFSQAVDYTFLVVEKAFSFF